MQRIWCIAFLSFLMFAVACNRSKTETMPAFYQGSWFNGEVKTCQIDSYTELVEHRILVCGDEARNTWHRLVDSLNDAKNDAEKNTVNENFERIEGAIKKFRIEFSDSNITNATMWDCRQSASGIACDPPQ